MIKILVATTSQRFDESDHPRTKILMPKIGPPAICFNNNLRPFLYMRVATLSRTTLPKPWTVLAFATLALVLAGATALDTDRSELSEVSTKHYVSVNDQSANVNENSAQGTVVLNTVVSGTPTGCTIGNGNTDQDGDGNLPFSIATDCVISVNDAGDLDYENYAQSYTLRIHVNDASTADIAFITITINDVNDVTPVYQAADADDAISVAENFGTGSIDAGTCLLYTSPSPRDTLLSRMPSSA